MILYHFCSERDYNRIRREGISRGMIAIMPKESSDNTFKGIRFHANWQWLTADPDPAHQSWATKNLIPYSRTAYRLTLEIPWDEAETRLYDRGRLKTIMPEADYLFDGWPGSEDWRVYQGYIPARWIKQAERMIP